MVPGGVTEQIAYFAGYFHQIEEVMKNRFVYEQGGISVRPDDYTAELKDFLAKNDLDEFDTDKIPFALPAPSEAILDPLLHGNPMRALPAIEETDYDADRAGRTSMPRKDFPIFLGPEGHGPQNISVTYWAGGEQQQADIKQNNFMLDDDRLLVVDGSGVEDLNQVDADATLERLLAEAKDAVPDDLPASQASTSSIVEFVVARDGHMAEGGDPNPHSIEPGRYVNGVLTDPPPDTNPVEPDPVPELNHELKGQWALLGGNQATNGALITDFKEGSNTMVVLGDFYKTNAVVQTNSYVDNDTIEISSNKVQNIVAGGTTTDNIAEFQQHAGPYDGIPVLYAGQFWNVRVVDGDFYDVNVVVQQNVLRDNDVSVQSTSQTHYEAHLGENQQLNVAKIGDGDIKYDLIVIGGDYHGANWIFQHNALLDSDVVKAAASGDASAVADQSVSTGANELLNEARIINYGDNVFQKPTEDMQSVVTALAEEQSSLSPAYGWYVPGNGSSVLNVLYVTGDYYDINAIWQTNVIADADTAVQYLSKTPPAAIAGDGSLTQSVSTGANHMTNEAIIVDVGATSSFVGGDVYHDTILIQGNLVGENNDKITFGDPSALVPEIVAFTGEECPAEEVTDIRAPIVPDDTLASILT
ncbi:hypothetical protein [Pseudorhodoplanes sp.]|uniref:hypothetical protein n=1 Tax=Pseudorhodoplanes sp. TaxID=1934341 RepID=UPI002BB0370C|nr:hypothetical protein [Pseudorhodoplanes sp.]HWV54229.1 hypothetical protein [Pseudorhodoplanes sp.]